MTTLTPDQDELLRSCAKDEDSYARLAQLFEEQHARLLESLHRQEALYRAVVEQQTELVCRYLPDTTLTFVNEAYCRFFNQPAESLIGRRFLTLLEEDTRALVWQRVQDYVVNPTAAIGENFLRRHDGSLRWIQWVRQPILNARGEVAEIQAVGRDISQFKNTEDALNRSEERYRRLIEASPDGIMITSEAVIRYANPALVRLLRAKNLEELQGKTVFDLLHPDYHELVRQRIETLGHDHEGATQRREQYVRFDGTVIDVEIAIAPIELDGQPASVTFVRDVTRYRQTEAALHGFQDQLRALHRLSVSLSKASSFDEFCRRAVEEGRSSLGFDRLGLWFLDENRTHIVGSYGTDINGQTIDERDIRNPTVNEFPGTHFSENRYLAYNDSVDLTDAHGNVFGKGWNALTALWNGDAVIGYLSADNLLSGQPASPNQLELLVSYGATLGHLATRIRAEEALRASEEAERQFQRQLRALHEINMELGQTSSFHDLCRRAIELGRSRLGFDRLSMWFIDRDGSGYMQGTFGIDEAGELRDETALRFSIADHADTLTRDLLAGKRLSAMETDSPLYNDRQQVIGRGWIAAASLVDGDQIIGCLYADNLLRQEPTGRYTLELLRLYGAALGHLAARKWSDEALRHSEQRYRAIFEGAGIGICTVNAKGLPVSCNPAFQQMLGYSSEELYRTPFLEFTHPDDRAENQSIFQELIDGKRSSHRYEKRYVHKNGDVIWVRVNASLFRASERGEHYVIALIGNLSEQKAAESKLEESELRNRALLEVMPDLMFLYDADGVFLDYHTPSPDRLMIPPEQFLNRHFADVLPPDIVEQTQTYHAAAIQTGQVQAFDYTLTVDGETRYYESRMLPYGKERVLSIVRDITDRKRVEAQLRESEDRFRQIADNVDEIFFIRDLVDSRILYVNPAYEKLWQRPREELYRNPRSFIEMIHPDDLPTVQAFLNRASYPDKLDLEYRITRMDGAVRWMWTRYFPIRDDQGNTHRLVGLVKDITERKQAEQSSLQLSLQNERIRIISEFIRDASHQFRTPLSIINSKVYLASKVDDPEARVAQLQGIQEQSDNILKLVESLVAMSRLDSDAAISPLNIDLNQMIHAICTRHQPVLHEKGIQLAPELDPNLPEIEGDVSELHNAFMHLLDNARRHTPAGGRITLRTYRASEWQAAVDFEDTGSGIEAADLPRIFDRFYRGEAAMSLPGFGLGLSMARKIIERHGGHIEVRSRPGKGSTFTILLPIASPEVMAMQPRRSTENYPNPTIS